MNDRRVFCGGYRVQSRVSDSRWAPDIYKKLGTNVDVVVVLGLLGKSMVENNVNCLPK